MQQHIKIDLCTVHSAIILKLKTKTTIDRIKDLE